MNNVAASEGLRAAGLLDSEGRYVEALEALKNASARGDLPAMTELAHRLLTGHRAPKSPKHALYFIGQAAKAGEGRALARLAALTAGGAYVKQDWRAALVLLAQAAAAGDEAARGQLQCLQPEGTTASVPASSPASWQSMAERVPLDYWLSAAPQEQLHDNVRRISNLAPLPVCQWLIARAQNRLQPALVYDAVAHENQLHEMRTNSMSLFDFGNFDVVQFLVQERMARTCGYRIQHFEAPVVLHYAVGQQITPHFDFIDMQAADYEQQIAAHGQRMITFLLYLNDDYAGGETTFPELGIVNRGTAGGGLYFVNAYPDLKPDRRMLHTGSPPTAGEKWIVSQFIVSKQLRP
jgi:prolyl 4-hydroxylase